jgi:hypothetical protein
LKLSVIPWIGRREKRGTEEAQVFTDHVRALGTGEPLDSGQFEALWMALRAALRRELKRRGMWESPPAYLGIFGGESWEPAGGTGRESALEELLAECYSYVFMSRLRSLQAQLKVKPNVEGLVVLSIRHFLHERQKEHDPIGSQVFEILQAAVQLAIAGGELRVLAGDEKVRNDTVLGFVAGMDVPGQGRGGLSALVARWNDELLPDLVTSRGRRQEEVVTRLKERLPDLLRDGIGTFRFKDLVDPLKADVRARWAALLDLDQGEIVPQMEGEGSGAPVRAVGPDQGVEERQLFRKLVECVLKALQRLQANEKTRGYLAVLWQFLRVQASEGIEAQPASRLGRTLTAELAAGDEERLSLRQLAEQLRIPRERLPGLYQTLGDLVERCRAAISGKTAVTSLKGDSTHERRG